MKKHKHLKWIPWLSIFLILLLSVVSSSSAEVKGRNVDAVEKAPNPTVVINPTQVSDAIRWIETTRWNSVVLWNETVRQNKIAAQKALEKQKIKETSITVTDGDFWRRLANCENPSGNAPGGYFQFMGSTRDRVGWAPGQSYEQQKAEAIWWAQQIHPNEGTSAGWPNCWWVALRG